MKVQNILCALASLGLLGFALPSASAAEKEKPNADVEARVTQTIKENFPDAVITDMGKETEDGLTFIGVDFTSKGTKVEADVMADGTLVGTEVAGELKAFPKAARKALKKATKGMTVKETEIATTYAKADPNDKSGLKATKLAQPIIAYEMAVEKDGHKGEFAVDADGKFLEIPKWAKEGEKSEGKEDKE
jgi:activator of 2-hydroxyglutaryl-CoA dehydratase